MSHSGQVHPAPRWLLWLTAATLLLLVLTAPVAFGQGAPSTATTQAPDKIEDPFGRDAPKGTVIGFIKAASDRQWVQAAQYVDTQGLSGDVEERMQKFLAVLDRALTPADLENLSGDPTGKVDDGLPPNIEQVGEYRHGDFALKLMLDRTQRAKQPPHWRFSAATLKAVPAAFERLQPVWFERFMWPPLREIRYHDVPLWQWLGIPLSLLLLIAFARLLSRGVFAALRPLLFRLTGSRAEAPLAQITGSIRLLSVSLALAIWAATTSLPLLMRFTLDRVAAALGIVGSAWLLLRLIEIGKQLVEIRLRRQNEWGRISFAQLAGSLAQSFVIVAALLAVLFVVGFDLTTALAGLGIGGIAIAFAAQKTLENLFGGVMIITDQPVRVGDFCRVGDVTGTVEQIGLRSTRIRTLDRTVVSVPNALMASMNLENFGTRDKFWFRPTLGLRYETEADQLRYVLAETRRMFYEHPMVESDSARIRFVRFGASSLDMEVFAYVRVGDVNGFLEVQEDLLLRIMDIIERSGTGFAFPSSTMYLARDRGLDREKTQEAVATVTRWRDGHQLPFPNFRRSRIAEFEGKLDYPPQESDLRRPMDSK